MGQRLRAAGFTVEALDVRELPAESLIQARFDDPAIAAALELVDRADGLVVVTPIYKAAYSGVLKTFLDLLPQFALAGKVALPLATGGTMAHVLAIDHTLRPLLAALNAHHIVSGLFLLDKLLERSPDGDLVVEPQLANRLFAAVDDFITAVRRARASVDPSAAARAAVEQQRCCSTDRTDPRARAARRRSAPAPRWHDPCCYLNPARTLAFTFCGETCPRTSHCPAASRSASSSTR